MTAFRVVRVTDLGPQFTDNPHRMIGQDGAYSIPLGSGKSLWFFGDTLFGKRVPRESLWFPGGSPLPPTDMAGHGGVDRMVTNCGLILRQTEASHGLTNFAYILDQDGNVRQLIHRLADEDSDRIRVWCQHGAQIGETLYLSYIVVEMLAEGPMPVNFRIIGSGLARCHQGNWECERLGSSRGFCWWKEDEPRFGSAIVTNAGDDCVYLFGVRDRVPGKQETFLARVAEPEVENLDAYMYYAGENRWAESSADAEPVFEGVPNEMSVAWNDCLDCWMAVHSLDLTGKIVARTAPLLTGPWSPPVELHQCVQMPLDYALPYPPLIYAGKEHPELSRDDGRILAVTYIEFEEYFPHLLEVEIERIT